MGPASDKLKGAKWQDALAPEQKALQYLLRAEATFRDIQVAFGQPAAAAAEAAAAMAPRAIWKGCSTWSWTPRRTSTKARARTQSADQRQRQVDEALQKLEQLARRQQELAEQQRRDGQQTAQQRWQQEIAPRGRAAPCSRWSNCSAAASRRSKASRDSKGNSRVSSRAADKGSGAIPTACLRWRRDRDSRGSSRVSSLASSSARSRTSGCKTGMPPSSTRRSSSCSSLSTICAAPIRRCSRDRRRPKPRSGVPPTG